MKATLPAWSWAAPQLFEKVEDERRITNGVEDDRLSSDDIHLESPDSDKHRETEIDHLMDTIDMEGSDCCDIVVNNLTLNHNHHRIDSNNLGADSAIPSLLGKPISGSPGPE
ncbi:hypothetical protein RUM44_009917 [Polyplax serrata]|uniref:Uncharacterized protein n=1 Tax=Polyplax serrata TaxID=468196 RepID=A0ABR1AU44_POLSC